MLPIVLALGACGLAGCGQKTAKSASEHLPTPITAYAKAVNLRNARSLTAVSPEHEISPPARASPLARCAGVNPIPGAIASARLEGPRDPRCVRFGRTTPHGRGSFRRRLPRQRSGRKKRVAADDSLRLGRCFADALGLVNIDPSHSRRRPCPSKRSPEALRRVGASGFRIRIEDALRSANPSVRPETHLSYFDVLDFAAGPTVIELTDFHISPPSIPRLEKHLLALLKVRAATNKA